MPSDLPTLDPDVLAQVVGALVVMTPEGEIVSWDRGAEILFGFSPEDLAQPETYEVLIDYLVHEKPAPYFEKLVFPLAKRVADDRYGIAYSGLAYLDQPVRVLPLVETSGAAPQAVP